LKIKRAEKYKIAVLHIPAENSYFPGVSGMWSMKLTSGQMGTYIEDQLYRT
jgi:hypothetical protein